MPQNGYSIGKDVSLDIVGPAGPIRFSIKTGWKSTPKFTDIEVKRLDGVNDHLVLPSGWNLSMDLERGGPEVDDFFATAEQRYFNGQDNPAVSVTETIREPNGAISTYRYTSVVLKLDDRGDWKGDATVKVKVSGMASRRLKVS